MSQDRCVCGGLKDSRSTVCKMCHNRRIAPIGYRATAEKYGEKWAVRHIQNSQLNKPSKPEQFVLEAITALGVPFERQYWLATKAKGRRQRVYLIDFMVSNWQGQRIALEVDGEYVHKRHVRRDRRKAALLKRRGIPLKVLIDTEFMPRNKRERDSKFAELVATLAGLLGLEP